MRKQLQQLGKDERHTFTAIFDRTGFKKGYTDYEPTLCLEHVKLNGEEVTNHLWFNYGKSFAKLGELEQGDLIQFDARVSFYQKGYYLGPKSTDCKLERPTKVKLLTEKDHRNPMPTDDKLRLVGYSMKQNEDFLKSNGRPWDKWYVSHYEVWAEKQDAESKELVNS